MKKFNKVLSIVLAVLMLASVAAFSATSASAAENSVIPKGTAIMFDNTSTEWTDVYIYGWAYGFSGQFLPMTQVTGTNLYYYILPEDVPVGVDNKFCLIVNQNNWSGATQTKDIAYTSTTVNTIVPSGTGSPLDYTWAYNTPPTINYVSATPSKSFAETLNIVLYTNCETAEYSINGAAPIEFTDGTNVIIGAAAAVGDKIVVTLTGYPTTGAEVTATYTYTKVGYTTINATVTGYDGPVYAYLFGGDRIGSAFYLMEKKADGSYTFQFEGAAQVIFTTTNNWDTAVKLLPADEPLVPAGATQAFALTYPTA